MEFSGLHTLSLPFVVQDALIAIGAAVALLACLAFINLGVLLPGLLTSLGGSHPDQRGAYLEFGPVGAPVISEPSSSRAAPPGAGRRTEACCAVEPLGILHRSTVSHLIPPTRLRRWDGRGDCGARTAHDLTPARAGTPQPRSGAARRGVIRPVTRGSHERKPAASHGRPCRGLII